MSAFVPPEQSPSNFADQDSASQAELGSAQLSPQNLAAQIAIDWNAVDAFIGAYADEYMAL